MSQAFLLIETKMTWKLSSLRSSTVLLLALVSGCVSLPSPEQRRVAADTLAKAQGWQGQSIAASPFTLMSYAPARQSPSAHLTVYIEGDGLAWISSDLPSLDPTPLHPLALQLALAQPSGNVAYLGRPCQYVDAEATGCAQRYWTEQRFAPEVIDATELALDRLKQQFHARDLTLVGYSGGAAVALLSAARRRDVTQVITVAGNLDHRAWTAYHRIRPLDGSLDPVDAIDALRMVPQVHFAGERDRVIPPALIAAYASRFAGGTSVTVIRQPGFDHQCCWAQAWPTLWRQLVR
jgi:dienelactone hydrolase